VRNVRGPYSVTRCESVRADLHRKVHRLSPDSWRLTPEPDVTQLTLKQAEPSTDTPTPDPSTPDFRLLSPIS
jgi:hypothetical protein